MTVSRPATVTAAQLALAFEQGQLVPHYQPIIDLNGDMIAGAETLLRRQHLTL